MISPNAVARALRVLAFNFLVRPRSIFPILCGCSPALTAKSRCDKPSSSRRRRIKSARTSSDFWGPGVLEVCTEVYLFKHACSIQTVHSVDVLLVSLMDKLPTLAELATKFLQRQGLSPSTVRSYESVLLPLLAEYGSRAPRFIGREHLAEYLQGLDHLGLATHHRHQAVLVALFNFAVEEGMIAANPLSGLKRRKPNAARGEHSSDGAIRYLTAEQMEIVYGTVAGGLRLHALVNFLHRTGTRISEVLALNLGDVDMERCRAQVIGKGNKRRWVFWGQDTAELLGRYLRWERHGEAESFFTARQPISGRVSRLSYRTAHSDWSKLITPVPELAGARLHDLRHTFATERVGLIAIEELRALMGHSRLDTTLRYQKVTSQRAEEVAKRAIEKLIQL